MDLYHLFSHVPLPLGTPHVDITDVDITGITSNSNDVQPGFLFVALKGTKQDGHTYIPKAIQAGAAAILAEEGTKLPSGAKTLLITTNHTASTLAKLAMTFYGRHIPSTIVGITGTNGKTSTATFLQQLWTQEKKHAVSLGTLGLGGLTSAPDFGPILTTPDSVTLAKILAYLGEHSITHLAMEASSHGLAQHRLDGLTFKTVGFTNLTRDHLDYHPTVEDYLNAKLSLLEHLEVGGPVIANADMETSILERITQKAHSLNLPLHTVGFKGEMIKLLNVRPLPQGQAVHLRANGQTHQFITPLVGHFQLQNMIMAAALSSAVETNTPIPIALLAHLQGVKGRMELAATLPNQAAVYVDYAHTPDALMRLLQALRPHTAGQLIVVFGAGGDRDAGKRPLMGEIAHKFANKVIVTDDNPRSEDPARIRKEILAAAPDGIEIADRKKAIEIGLSLLKSGDILVVAGKGHEEGQIISGQVYPFNDVKAIQSLIGSP
ncbi:UDP-N-acetylmuramoyl-L-alanyl-D-glutamate--2,6-diaminopimelate ligase [Entomobacter blattae]|uniref:UDP-N-acetylmuramoyl-L-alanyl-D-glutamate--2,6-diaminopimelate ligase n=1 Tax=Entomobacter blattae TaxID=2762277 RepID=A0A7H1NNR5_9PROT|nr:UDP-N-acetylmuramoyl-L-alanyl-D-glutamate--2,6-diaminopimelate ligase [Entomobacter blattae]QNT77425.1 UDP-N-acetylmuramoyl-L-alanyl-D-glutamate--2,6-diaminopimelate ligase [Entomobacter blattae]